MTESQAQFTVALLIILLALLVWMTAWYRKRNSSAGRVSRNNYDGRTVDREEMIKRVSRMDEVSSREIYKRVYQITDEELASARGEGKRRKETQLRS